MFLKELFRKLFLVKEIVSKEGKVHFRRYRLLATPNKGASHSRQIPHGKRVWCIRIISDIDQGAYGAVKTWDRLLNY